MAARTLALTDLETRLAQPGGAALRDSLLQQAAELEARLHARLAAGLSRDEYAPYRAAAEAARAAQEVLRQYLPGAATDTG